MTDDKGIREALTAAAADAFNKGLFAGTSGNLSCYERESGVIYITPSGVRYETMTAEDIMAIDIDGEIVAGVHKPSSEWRLHAEIYRSMEDVSSVVHTHSPYATAFAAARKPIPAALTETRIFLGGSVECAPYEAPGSVELAMSVLAPLKGRGGCLLAHHGAVAVGGDMREALTRAEYIEDSARICIYASLIGGVRPIPDDR